MKFNILLKTGKYSLFFMAQAPDAMPGGGEAPGVTHIKEYRCLTNHQYG